MVMRVPPYVGYLFYTPLHMSKKNIKYLKRLQAQKILLSGLSHVVSLPLSIV